MAHFAKIENNVVQQVIVIDNGVIGEPELTFPETEIEGCAFIADILKFDGVWKQTSYNGTFRNIYAGIGFTFNADADVFVAPQPYPSWTLDANHDWQPPTPKPEGGYKWNEAELEWVAI